MRLSLVAVELEPREDVEGHGWQTHGGALALGVHEIELGPDDRFSLVRFTVDMKAALERHVGAHAQPNRGP